MKAASVSVVIPCYDEARRLGPFLDALLAFRETGGRDWEIVVVDDGSTDGTAALARSKGARVVSLPMNRGKGAAVRAGFESAAGETLLFIDADGSVAASEIPKVLAALASAPTASAASRPSAGRRRKPSSRTCAANGGSSTSRFSRKPGARGFPSPRSRSAGNTAPAPRCASGRRFRSPWSFSSSGSVVACKAKRRVDSLR